jgi:hypothetical protein
MADVSVSVSKEDCVNVVDMSFKNSGSVGDWSSIVQPLIRTNIAITIR